MAPTWNDTQRAAIEARGANTIVSAGAGSGKTAVLTERVAQLVKQGHPVSSLLVLTFTNAAAAEMKQRIRDRLSDLQLHEAAATVDRAYIMTFDAYALTLARRYHYALGLEPDIGILDEPILDLLGKRALASIFDHRYASRDQGFLRLIGTYSVRSDDALRNLVLALSRLADLKPDKRAYYEHYVTEHFSTEYIENAWLDYRRWVDGQLNEILASVDCFDEATYRHTMHEEITALTLTDDFDMKITSIAAYAFPSTRKCQFEETQKNALKRIKNQFAQLKTKVTIGSKQDLVARYLKTKPYVETLINLAEALDEEMMDFKKRHNRFSFPDVAKMAIRLVNEKEIHRELTNEIRFIMIDEYQDTNDLQDRFIQGLAQDNVFMVGDVKQSIYRFRNANCTLFTEKYNAYRGLNGGRVIDMNTNYRSRSEVIGAINRLFGRLMKVDLGGVDYRSDHEIGYGQTAYEQAIDSQADYGLKVYGYEAENADDAMAKEIDLIAQDIIAKKNRPRYIYDKNEKKMRPIAYGDFAILIDRRGSFKTYAGVFERYGIPLEVEFVDEMRQSDVLNVFENLIRLVAGHGCDDYPTKYRHELASVWRSFLYRLDDQTIFVKLKDLAHQESDPLFMKIATLAANKDQMPLGRLIAMIALDFELHQATIHLGDVMSHAGRIDGLIHLAEGLQDIGMTMADLVAYFDDAEDLNAPVVFDNPTLSHDAVKLMTIHQSKGLEFPVVYYPGLYKQFNLPEESASSYAHGRYGLVLPVPEDDKVYSFFHHLVRAEERKAALSEEMRKLYVALTRARETMIVLVKQDDDETIPSQPRSFADFLRLAEWPGPIENPKPAPQPRSEVRPQTTPLPIVFRELHVIPIIKTSILASQVQVGDRASARFGTRLHAFMSRLDYARPSLESLPKGAFKDRITDLLQLLPLKDARRALVYQEYSFYDPKQDLFGTIDLMLVYDDRIDIIDFKTGSLDHQAYDRQLRAYHHYVAMTAATPINLYLVSLTRNEYRTVSPKEESR